MRVKSVANIWKIRNRQCNGAKIGSDSCPKGENVETQPCGGFPCARWASWNNWSPCSRTCGVSESVRVRTCIFGSIGDDGCPEEDSKDNRECKQDTCGKFILKKDSPKDRNFPKPESSETGSSENRNFWKRKILRPVARSGTFKNKRDWHFSFKYDRPFFILAGSVSFMTTHFGYDPFWIVKIPEFLELFYI